MGRWGLGNLDSDDALTYLETLIESCLNTVKQGMTEEKLASESFLEYIGESKIIPAIDILILLCEHYGISPDCWPDVSKLIIRQWKQTYLTVYDKNTWVYFGEFKAERRAVIAQTFDKLEELSIE